MLNGLDPAFSHYRPAVCCSVNRNLLTRNKYHVVLVTSKIRMCFPGKFGQPLEFGWLWWGNTSRHKWLFVTSSARSGALLYSFARFRLPILSEFWCHTQDKDRGNLPASQTPKDTIGAETIGQATPHPVGSGRWGIILIAQGLQGCRSLTYWYY